MAHVIDPEGLPYAPEKLPRKPVVGAEGFFALDLRAGRVTAVEEFPEARKPAWKLTVDFGPVVGELRTSAQVTNYPREQLLGRMVVGAGEPGREAHRGLHLAVPGARHAGAGRHRAAAGGGPRDPAGRSRRLTPGRPVPPDHPGCVG